MTLRAHRSAASLLLCLSGALGCAGGSDAGTAAGGDAGLDSGEASAPSRTAVSCFPGDPMALACDPTTEICIDDYAGAGGFTPHQQCKPLPAPCQGDRSCACVLGQFKCGITTTCSDADGGIVQVTCQPD